MALTAIVLWPTLGDYSVEKINAVRIEVLSEPCARSSTVSCLRYTDDYHFAWLSSRNHWGEPFRREFRNTEVWAWTLRQLSSTTRGGS
jgi:hypothetical protein